MPRPAPVNSVTPPAPATDKSKGDAPRVTPPEVAPVPPTIRRPVPSKAEQAATRKVLKEVFAEQLADRSISARQKLTEALTGQAGKSAERPVEQFVLLGAAMDAGAEAANLPLAFEAGDLMAEGSTSIFFRSKLKWRRGLGLGRARRNWRQRTCGRGFQL